MRMGLLFMVVFAAVGVSAQEAAPAVESTGFDWKTIATFLFGVIGMKVVSYLADLLNGKGAEYVSAKLEALQEKLNENSLLGQIQADDAITKILEDAIPTIFDTLTETAKQDLADGKFDRADWDGLGAKLWDEVKDHIIGGKNDYLENSSFNDGKAIATWVIQNWFKKKKAEGALPISGPVK